MQLLLEVEGEGEQAPLPEDGAALAAFLSFAVSRGFGAQHPLIALADRMHDVHRVRMGPLTTFYEAGAEDSEDEEKLEMAWQPAEGLRVSLEGLAAALGSDPQCAALVRRAGMPGLVAQVEALLEKVRVAEGEGKRVRLSYIL